MEGASQEVVLVESADGIFHSLALTVELNAAGQVNVTRRFREQCARFCRRYLNSDDLNERLILAVSSLLSAHTVDPSFCVRWSELCPPVVEKAIAEAEPAAAASAAPESKPASAAATPALVAAASPRMQPLTISLVPNAMPVSPPLSPTGVSRPRSSSAAQRTVSSSPPLPAVAESAAPVADSLVMLDPDAAGPPPPLPTRSPALRQHLRTASIDHIAAMADLPDPAEPSAEALEADACTVCSALTKRSRAEHWARRVSLRWLNAKRRAAVESGPSQLEFLCALVLGARTALTLHPESAPESELKCDAELKITVPAVTTKGLPIHPLRSFEFKDYAAGVFAKLRAAAGISPAMYLSSLAHGLADLDIVNRTDINATPNKDKEGTHFFVFSRDRRLLISSISQERAAFIRKTLLPVYAPHVLAQPNTLLTRLLGLHRVEIKDGRKMHVMVSLNAFHRDEAGAVSPTLHRRLLLNGAVVDRRSAPTELYQLCPLLLDQDAMSSDSQIQVGAEKKAAFMRQLRSDCSMLASLKLTNYAATIGIVSNKREAELRSELGASAPIKQQLGASRSTGSIPTASRMSSSSSVASLPKAAPTSLQPIDSVNASSEAVMNARNVMGSIYLHPAELLHLSMPPLPEPRRFGYYGLAQNEVPFRASEPESRDATLSTYIAFAKQLNDEAEHKLHAVHPPARTHLGVMRSVDGDITYYAALIDIFTPYSISTRVRNMLASAPSEQLAAIDPEDFAKRFVSMMESRLK